MTVADVERRGCEPSREIHQLGAQVGDGRRRGRRGKIPTGRCSNLVRWQETAEVVWVLPM